MAKRIGLREFQQSLAERLTQAVRGEVATALLGVESGGSRWLLDLPDAGEVVPLPPLTEVPLTKRWLAGVANVRGVLYSVVDLAIFQGHDDTLRNGDARLLLVGARHGTNSALLVSRILGLRPLDTLTTEPPAPNEGRPWIGGTYRDPQGGQWKKLNIKRLLSAPEFMEVGL